MTTEPRPLPTPGPWKVVNGFVIEVVAVSDTKLPAIVKWQGFDDGDRSEDEHLANAALIARAPELAARVEELERESATLHAQYCDLMEAVKQSRMEHGDCKSGKRYNGKPLACTACMAQLKLDEMISAYKGRRIVLA